MEIGKMIKFADKENQIHFGSILNIDDITNLIAVSVLGVGRLEYITQKQLIEIF